MNSTLPEAVLLYIEEELSNIHFGKLNLEVVIHDKQPKFRIIKEISIIPDKFNSGQQKKGD